MARGGEFFEYLEFRFLLVECRNGASDCQAIYEGKHAKMTTVQQVADFFEQVGTNTQYIIHPEEILAENFRLLLMGEQSLSSPEIVKKMKDILVADSTLARPDSTN